ncbi:helix-turn-helix domain-containing protein [Shouchella lehensis]|uniref:XRE family transcriptional regulator n=1 Tax=Shouchella lehensis TaxID=300825 RepID=A0A4Y7WHZ8_9BACI|nr:helix-turn-helix transcriptional regulator [Shouchella lehensis]TES48043.1 XRE family transcriptional regulator [Shouchella lehensis]
MEAKKLGTYIAKLRKESGFKSQRQLAEASGLSNGTIARIENGTQKPSMETLSTLSKHLKVELIDLYTNAGYSLEANDLRVKENTKIYFDDVYGEITEQEREALEKHLDYLRWQAKQDKK